MNSVQSPLEALTILIAEDSAADRLLLSTIVRRQGHAVLTAANGAEAVEAFRSQHPQLVLMDAMMPVMDGLEFAKAIRALPVASQLPIILISGAQAHIGMQRSDLFDAVLEKPFNIDLVIAKARELLALS